MTQGHWLQYVKLLTEVVIGKVRLHMKYLSFRQVRLLNRRFSVSAMYLICLVNLRDIWTSRYLLQELSDIRFLLSPLIRELIHRLGLLLYTLAVWYSSLILHELTSRKCVVSFGDNYIITRLRSEIIRRLQMNRLPLVIVVRLLLLFIVVFFI